MMPVFSAFAILSDVVYLDVFIKMLLVLLLLLLARFDKTNLTNRRTFETAERV